MSKPDAESNCGRPDRVHESLRPQVSPGRQRLLQAAVGVVSDNMEPGERSCLPSVGLGDLADELGPAHIHRRVDLAGLRTRIVFEDFDHQGRIVRDDDARL